MRSASHPTAVLFDFNGTLADDEHCLLAAFQGVARTAFGVHLDAAEYRAEYLGNGDRAALTALADLLARYRHAAAEHELIGPDTLALVAGLAERGVPLAVVTAAQRAEVTAVLDRCGLTNAFAVVVTAEDVRRGKPDPEPYRTALAELGLPGPAGAVAVEDSLPGLAAARGAGLVTVGVRGSTEEARLLAAADVVVDRLGPHLLGTPPFTWPAAPEPDGAAFTALFEQSSAFGATPDGGLHRLALSEADGRARDHLSQWLVERGFTRRVDAVGNLFGVLEWTPGASFVVAGSHLDSQPHGGRFDGCVGVLAAAVAADAIRERVARGGEPPRHNLAVVDWTNEEGARFQPSLIGSSHYAGTLTTDAALAATDGAGTSVATALDTIGYRGTDPAPWPAAACVELHVEQGTVLTDAGCPIGVVTTNWAAAKHRLVLHGRQAHTGPTPMAQRRDALLAAGHLLVAVRELADRLAPAVLHTSVGRLVVEPNSPNVVPARVTMSVELRAPDPGTVEQAVKLLGEACVEVATRTGVLVIDEEPTTRSCRTFDPAGTALARRAAAAVGARSMPMATVAGHDAVAVNAVAPAIVLFVPSVGGVAHHHEEYTAPADLQVGLAVLTELLWRLCCGELCSGELDPGEGTPDVH